MFTIKVQSEFCGAHNLRRYKGKCERLHGHNWKVEAEIESKTLDKTGMVVDFKIAKAHLNAVIERLDHRYLNDVPFFMKNNPTSENMAFYVYRQLGKFLKGLRSVTVWETGTSQATYSERQ